MTKGLDTLVDGTALPAPIGETALANSGTLPELA
jgi:hypothetical protein